MKTKLLIFIALVALTSCNSNKDEMAKLKSKVDQDSVLLIQSTAKDSTIASYLEVMNQIQAKLDSIKIREKILTVSNGPENSAAPGTTIATDIKSIDQLIISYNKRINDLAANLKKSQRRDANFERMVADLNTQLTGKEAEITAIQTRLSLTSDSVKTLTGQFNDSLATIQNQRTNIATLTADKNTVYYVAGTNKQLEKAGVIDKTGGFIGLGKTKQLNPNVDNSIFVKADKTTLSAIPLNGKYKGLITQHGGGTFRISGKGKADTLLILDPAFWNDSKYLVISVK